MVRENAILTYTNTLFYPLDPRVDEVKIEDIAHSLSQMCRANGHFKAFYSVAQHSLNCAQEARARGLSGKIQFACLLHDASEAYISDVTRPVKCYLDEYRKIEYKLQRVIYAKFGIDDLTDEEKRNVDDIDDALLYYEFENLHQQGIHEQPPQIYSCPDIVVKSMISVEAKFIRMTRRYMDNIEPGAENCKVIGIDSCNKTSKYYGWAAFWLDVHDGYGFGIYHKIEEIVADHHDADCMLIDIPVGLPENEQDEAVRPDRELRNRLKGKSSSVFNTPCRQAVYCQDKQDAKAINVQFLHKSLSEQSLGFTAKIREVDLFLSKNLQYIGQLRESHPEYAFAVLNDGKALKSKKTTCAGLDERKLILSQHFIHTEKAIGEIMSQYPKSLIDDFVDAMVLAVIGQNGMEKGFDSIPKEPVKDNRGIPMEIVYCREV